MKTACFNLVDERWLPVTLADDFPGRDAYGALPRVSLREVFEHGDKIVEFGLLSARTHRSHAPTDLHRPARPQRTKR